MTPERARISASNATVIQCPGWDVSYDDGDWIAVRKERLSAYQTTFGAIQQFVCDRPDELWLICEAQRRLAEQLRTAEQVIAADRAARLAKVKSPDEGGSPERDVDLGSSARPAP